MRMSNKFISDEYAKELQSDLEEAIKINPDMFNLDKVAEFSKQLQDFEGNFFETLHKFDQIYKEEVRFTEDEYNTIKQIVTEAGHTIKEENKKPSKEVLGDNYNPLRDDYLIVLDNDIAIHFLKMHKRRGGFIVDAKEGIKVEYNILKFLTVGKCEMFFNNPDLDILLYKRSDTDDDSFESNMDNLRKAFKLDYTRIETDRKVYWDKIDEFDHARWKARDEAEAKAKKKTRKRKKK